MDKYVIYNYTEDIWQYGSMARTAWLDTGLRNFPLAATYSYNIVEHENGVDDGITVPATAIEASITSSHYDIGDGNNFARTMLKLASSGVNPNVVNDQFGRPTLASLLAKFAIHLCDTSPEYSTYNLSNEGPTVSWCDLAKTIFEMSGNDPGRVSGLSTEDYFKDKAHANRPKNSTFSLEKAKSTGFEIPEWKEDLKKYIDEELKK